MTEQQGVLPRPLVLNTSVAVKWYLPEELRDEALSIFDAMVAGDVLGMAPSTIQPEFWNALWQKHRRGELTLEEVREIWGEFAKDPVRLYKPEDLMPRAVEIASTGVIVYDALFLALAEAAGTVVVTADGKLLKALEETSFAGHARHLGEVRSLL